ncbi:hypothetical protein BJ875DRAFT_286677 [Amylocarpus encephaloides]|uniref:DNA-binding protein RAP1 n=1 Tax=Amylocarpus encephaloides TaxID=45428 RepID=A0A9P7YSG1_9HELO|nr:hypothetical protein BJ875DRAFT_286677 [Amylocarpus encephaloides]
MARVVYEGVRGGEGELFAGIKFYFLQRIPTRSTWIELVQNNGGEIVKLDKNADFIIGDHARQNQPPGAVSWKWIEDSVRTGELADIEKHCAGPPKGTIREVGSGKPVKRGKTPFTVDDDKVLMAWVLKAERSGISTKGNETYKRLEMKNPRHTFQSWRDRWIKYVSYHARPALPTDDDDELDNREDEIDEITRPKPATTTRRPAPKVSPKRPTKVSEPTPIPSKSKTTRDNGLEHEGESPEPSTSSRPVILATCKPFTPKENRLLQQSYADIENLDEDRTIDAWMNWALKYPTHSAQEWRNHYNKKIKPLMVQDGVEEEDEVEDVERTTFNHGKTSRTHNSPSKGSPQKPPNEKSLDISSGPRPDQTPIKSPREQQLQVSSDSPQSTNAAVDPTTTDEHLFEQQVRELAEVQEFELEINPEICGRTTPLFRLWQVVMSEELGGYDHVTGAGLWPKVADALGFDQSQLRQAASDLKDCYNEILADYEILREEYRRNNQDLTDSQEIALEAQLHENSPRYQLQQQRLEQTNDQNGADQDQEEDFDDVDAPFPSSKRRPSPLEERSTSAGWMVQAWSFNKRQKIDKGKGRTVEIPGTPEEITFTSGFKGPHEPSPLNSQAQVHTDTEQDGLDNLDTETYSSPSRKLDFTTQPAKKLARFLEPETQDFRFGTQAVANRPSSVISVSSDSPSEVDDALDVVDEVKETFPDDPSTQSQTQSQKEQDLIPFIERWVGLGYEEELVIDALEATSMQTDDFGPVVESLKQGEGIPKDMRGVWPKEDDEALYDADSHQFLRLVSKHTARGVQERREFLKDMHE